MMTTWYQVIAIVAVGFSFAFIGILMGAYLMFKAKSVPGSGESFLVDPKGDVFNIDKDDDEVAFTGQEEAEKTILKNTDKFLKILGGA